MKIMYLNKPDKSDINNDLRVLSIVLWRGFYLNITWFWPPIKFGRI